MPSQGSKASMPREYRNMMAVMRPEKGVQEHDGGDELRHVLAPAPWVVGPKYISTRPRL